MSVMAQYHAVSEGFTTAPFRFLAEKKAPTRLSFGALCFALMSTCGSDLELVSHADSNDVVGNVAGTYVSRKIAFVQLVDFVIDHCREVFVEVVGCAYVNIFNQV
jgi:hypothetical protein